MAIFPNPGGGADLYPGTALVTGGGSGLGLEIARVLIRDGFKVIITGRNEAKLQAAAAELGVNAQAFVCDVADEESVSSLVGWLKERDIRVSVLINNAGIGGPGVPMTQVSAQEWDEVFEINVRGTFLMCRAFLPDMVEAKNGAVINIASVTGKRPLINRTPYAASKMAVIGLTQTLAFEVSPHGVMVNTLSPGPIESERMSINFAREAALSGTTPEEVEKNFVSRAALGRMVTLEEVAQAVSVMLSMPNLTGSDIDFSGGMIA